MKVLKEKFWYKSWTVGAGLELGRCLVYAIDVIWQGRNVYWLDDRCVL